MAQYSYIEAAKQKGYDVLVADGQLDTPFMNQQEQKQSQGDGNKGVHFNRIDADTLSNLIRKADQKKVEMTDAQRRENRTLFESQIPAAYSQDGKKVEWSVDFQAMDETDKPVMIAQNEWMRRMKEMSRVQGGGMNFYGQMPEQFNLIVNTEHPVVKSVLDKAAVALTSTLAPVAADIMDKDGQIKPLEEEKYKAKAGEFPHDKDELLDALRKDVEGLKKQESDKVAEYAKGDATLRQLIDLALLEGGMLKGEALAQFIKRSQQMLG